MEFDKKDQQVIENLYHNWRISSSELSRKTKLSRRQVDYRIKQYFSQNVIRAIFTVFDYSKLNFKKPVYLFVALKDKKDVSLFGEHLEKTKRCTSWGKTWTEYDLFSNLIFRNKKEMNKTFSELRKKFKNKIQRFTVVDPIHAEFYPLKVIEDSFNETYNIKSESDKKTKIDSIDINILKQISYDARKSIVEIAENSKISPERALYRLRRLYKEKVILGSRIQFDLNEAGYLATCLFVRANLNLEVINKLKHLCKKELSVNYLIVSESDPQIIIQVFHKDAKTLRKIIIELNSLIADKVINISSVELEDDMNIVNPLPFI